MDAKQYFRRSEVPAYLIEAFALQVSESQLAKLAVTGGGPEFHKAGKWPVYSRSALDAWATKRLGPAVRSTAEYTARAA